MDESIDYGLNDRSTINKFFTTWLDYHNEQKQKWGNLVKYKYLIQKNKLNRVFWGWKLQIRQLKVNKLKMSLISHAQYKLNLRATFRAWKAQFSKLKKGLHILYKVSDKRMKMLFIKYLDYNLENQWKKEHQNAIALNHRNKLTSKKLFNSFICYKNLSQNEKVLSQTIRSVDQECLKKKYFDLIREFSQLTNKKVISGKKINIYLVQKYRLKALHALKQNLQKHKINDQNLRKAMQFQVYRHRFYLAKQTYRIFKQGPLIARENKLVNEKKADHNLLSKYFKLLLKAVQMDADQHNQTVKQYSTQLLRIKFFSMWKKQIQHKLKQKERDDIALRFYDERLCIRIMKQIKFFIDKQRKINQASQIIKRTTEQKVLGQVLQRLNDIKQIKRIRERLLIKVLNKLTNKHLYIGYQKIKMFSVDMKRKTRANNLRKQTQRRKAFKALKQYYEHKIRRHINLQLTRKFRYLRLLQKGLNMMKDYVQLKNEQLDKEKLAQKQYKIKLINKIWHEFKEVDDVVKYNKKRVINHIHLKNQEKLFKCFRYMVYYRNVQQEKKQKLAMAYMFHDRLIQAQVFYNFKSLMDILIRKNSQKKQKYRKSDNLRYKNFVGKCFNSIKQFRRISKEYKNKVKQLQSSINMVKKAYCLNSLKEFSIFSQELRQKNTIGYLFWRRIRQIRLINFLRQNVQYKKQQKIKHFRALKFWSRTVKRNIFIAFQAYHEFKQQANKQYQQAFEDRNRIIVQNSIFKLMKVAQYWINQRVNVNYSFDELQAKQAFVKWKHSTFQGLNKNPVINRFKQLSEKMKTTRQTSFNSESKQLQQQSYQISNKETTQEKETVEWLYSFDKNSNKTKENDQKTSSALDDYLEKKKKDLEIKHKSKLREFDHFLTTMQPTKLQNDQKSFHSKSEQQQSNINAQNSNSNTTHQKIQAPRNIQIDPSLTPISRFGREFDTPLINQTIQSTRTDVNRISQIQNEIQLFLKEKELLRQLEANDAQSLASKLLRDEIQNKSITVKNLCDELKVLKSQSQF